MSQKPITPSLTCTLITLVPNQNVVLPLLQQNKKDSNKCHYPFYMGTNRQS